MSLSAGTYTLDFAAAQRGNYNHGGQVLQVLVDGAAVGRRASRRPARATRPYASVNFTVAAGTHTITIAGLNPHGGDNTALIDNVFVQPAWPISSSIPTLAPSSVGVGLAIYAQRFALEL